MCWGTAYNCVFMGNKADPGDGGGIYGGFQFELLRVGRSLQKPESSISCRIPVVVAKQSAKPLAAVHLPYSITSCCCWFIHPAGATTISFIRSIDGV